MTVWCIVIHEVQTYTTFGVVDKRCTSLRLRLHGSDFCACGTGPGGDGIQVQCCLGSELSDGVLVDLLRNESTAIAAFVTVNVIDQSGAFVEDSMTSWAFDMLHFLMGLLVSANCAKRLGLSR